MPLTMISESVLRKERQKKEQTKKVTLLACCKWMNDLNFQRVNMASHPHISYLTCMSVMGDDWRDYTTHLSRKSERLKGKESGEKKPKEKDSAPHVMMGRLESNTRIQCLNFTWCPLTSTPVWTHVRVIHRQVGIEMERIMGWTPHPAMNMDHDWASMIGTLSFLS